MILLDSCILFLYRSYNAIVFLQVIMKWVYPIFRLYKISKFDCEQRKKELSSFFLGSKRRGEKILYAITKRHCQFYAFYACYRQSRSRVIKIFLFEGLTFFTGTSWNSVEGRESFGACHILSQLWVARRSRWSSEFR